MTSRDISTRSSPHTMMSACLEFLACSQHSPRMGPSSLSSTTSSRPSGSPMTKAYVSSFRRTVQTPSSRRYGIRRRIHCTCAWALLSEPMPCLKSMPSTMYPMVAGRRDSSPSEDLTMPSPPPIQTGQSSFSDPRGIGGGIRTTTRICISWRMPAQERDVEDGAAAPP